MTSRLGWRYPPLPGQDFQDYVNVLAEKNGLFSKSLFRRVAKTPKKAGEWDIQSKAGRKKLDTISRLTGHSEASLLRNLRTDYNLNGTDYYVGEKHLHHKHPRVCPQCLVESPAIMASWRYTPATHCTIHSRRLEDTCPKCDSRLSWESDRRIQCNCEQIWQPIDFNAGDKNKTLPKYLSQSSHLHLSPIIDRIARPLDSLAGSVKLSALANKDVDFLYQTAFDYSESQTYRDLFDKECVQRRKELLTEISKSALYHNKWEGMDFSHNSKHEFSADAGSMIDRLCDLSTDFETMLKLVTPRRYQHTDCISSEELISQADTDQVADVLNLPKSDLRRLIDTNVLPQIASHKTTRDALFDLRGCDLTFATKLGKSTSTDISYRKLIDSNYLNLFRCSIADLITSINSKSISAYSESY